MTKKKLKINQEYGWWDMFLSLWFKIMGPFGLAFVKLEVILQHFKSNSTTFQYVWFGFSELLLSSKSNSP